MKFRTTLILFLLVIGLGAFLIFFSLRQPSAREYKDRDRRVFPITEFEKSGEARKGLAEMATRIDLRNGKDAIVLERATGSSTGWRIAAPVSYAADPGIVSSILSEVEFLTAARVIDPAKEGGLDLSLYGLSAPEQSVSVTVDGRAFRVDLGTRTTDGKSAYVTTEKKLIYVVPVSILTKAATSLDELRDKTVLRFEKPSVTRITAAATGKPAVELQREKAVWKMLRPAADETDGAAVTKLLDAVAALRVGSDDFVADKPADLAEYGLNAPSMTLGLYEGDKRRTLLIGAAAKHRSDKVYAMTDQEACVFELDKRDVDGLPAGATELRCRIALPMETADAMRIETTGPAKVVLTKSGEEWKMEEPAGQAASADAVRLFLAKLTGLEVRDRVDDVTPERLKEAGLAPPRAVVAVTTREGGVGRLLVGAEQAGKLVSVRRGESGPILTVSSELWSDLVVGYVAFLSRRVLDVPRDRITGVAIAQPGKTVMIEKKDKRWTFTEPTVGAANAAAVDQLLWAVAYVEAQMVVSDKPEPALYGFDAPRFKVTLTVSPAEGKSETRTLVIGKDSPGGLFAMTEGGKYVYSISKDIVKPLTADLTPPAPAQPAATPGAPLPPAQP